MTNIEKSLLAHLETYDDLTTLVSDRIYPQQRDPGEQLPCVTYALDDAKPLRNIDTAGSLIRAEFEIRCWALNHRVSREIADAIIGNPEVGLETRLQDHRGWLGTIAQRHWVQSSSIEEQQEESERAAQGRKRGTFCVILKLVLWYDRS